MSKPQAPQILPEVFQTWPKEAQEYILALQSYFQTQLDELKALLSQNSQNSSKPPSSDPPWQRPPKKTKNQPAKPKGGQVGHSKNTRDLLPPEQLTEIIELEPSHCSECRSLLLITDRLSEPTRHQVTELPVVKAVTTEYQLHRCLCPVCHTITQATLPQEVPTGQFGARLLATAAVLRAKYHLSLRQSQDLLQQLYGVELSLGGLADGSEKVSRILEPVYAQACQIVQHSEMVNVDETSWAKPDGLNWLWVAVSTTATVFLVTGSRCKLSLKALIGADYGGIVHSDRHKAYYILPEARHQLCWAHLIRNLLGLACRDGPTKEWAEIALTFSDHLFEYWSAFRAGELSRTQLQAKVEPIKAEFKAQLEAGKTDGSGKVKGFCRGLLPKYERLWLFVKVPGVEPTNNAAEQALRGAVIWRKICYGSQSHTGERFVERLLTVSATCQKQKLNLLDYLVECIQAHWLDWPAPSLVNLAVTP